MARHDIYVNPDGPGLLLDVQADVLSGLNTRVVVPLMPLADAPLPARRLNPVFDIGGEALVMISQFMAAVPVAWLGKPVGSLADRHYDIVAAIDFLHGGY